MWIVAQHGILVNLNHVKKIMTISIDSFNGNEQFNVIGIDLNDKETVLQSFDTDTQAEAYIATLAQKLYKWGMQHGENEKH